MRRKSFSILGPGLWNSPPRVFPAAFLTASKFCFVLIDLLWSCFVVGLHLCSFCDSFLLFFSLRLKAIFEVNLKDQHINIKKYDFRDQYLLFFFLPKGKETPLSIGNLTDVSCVLNILEGVSDLDTPSQQVIWNGLQAQELLDTRYQHAQNDLCFFKTFHPIQYQLPFLKGCLCCFQWRTKCWYGMVADAELHLSHLEEVGNLSLSHLQDRDNNASLLWDYYQGTKSFALSRCTIQILSI